MTKSEKLLFAEELRHIMDASEPKEAATQGPSLSMHFNSPCHNLVANADRIEINIHLGTADSCAAAPENAEASANLKVWPEAVEGRESEAR